MKTIAFVNGKGGTGKTTMSILTALAAANAGFEVGIKDTDPQQSSASWVETINPHNIEILNNNKQYKLVIVDTPPRLDDPSLIKNIKNVDNIYLVTSLDPADIMTSKRTLTLLTEHSLTKKTKIIINQYQINTRLSKAQDQTLAQLNVPIFKNKIGDRQVYKLAMLFGWEALNPKGKDELSKIILEMFSE